MKHRATIDLEFTNGDLFEQEVIKAMRAYAKTMAREAFQNEVEDTAKVWARRLYESRYTEPMTDKLVKAEVQSYIKEQMSHKEMLDLIQGTVQAAVFAVIHISFSSFSPKAKVRIRHYARKPEARYAGGFPFTHSHCKQRS